MAKLIEINKSLYSVGITWRLRYTHKKSEIINQASKDFDAYVFYPSQVGFLDTKKDEKHLKSLPLASSLKLSESSFLGIFNLKDIYGATFYSLIMIHEGIIVGSGDSVFGSIKEAENRIIGMEDLFSSKIENKVICDTYQKSLDFLEQNLVTKSFFPKNKIKPLYKSRANNTKLLLMLIAIISVPIAYMSITKYVEYQEQKSIEDARLLFLQDKEKRKRELQENAENIFKQEWKNKALPIETFQICQGNLFVLPMIYDGWLLDKASCKNTTMVITNWLHQKQADYTNLPFDGHLKNTKEVVAKHSIQKQYFLTNQAVFESLLSKNVINQKFYQLTQNIGASIKIDLETPESKEYKDLKISITSPWQKGKFILDSIPVNLLLNTSLYRELETIPSLYITEIEYNNQSHAWSIKGEFYVLS